MREDWLRRSVCAEENELPTAGPSAAGGGVTDRQMEGGETLLRKLCMCV